MHAQNKTAQVNLTRCSQCTTSRRTYSAILDDALELQAIARQFNNLAQMFANLSTSKRASLFNMQDQLRKAFSAYSLTVTKVRQETMLKKKTKALAKEQERVMLVSTPTQVDATQETSVSSSRKRSRQAQESQDPKTPVKRVKFLRDLVINLTSAPNNASLDKETVEIKKDVGKLLVMASHPMLPDRRHVVSQPKTPTQSISQSPFLASLDDALSLL